MARYAAKWPGYARDWDRMKINKNRQAEFDGIARKILAHRGRYVVIEQMTGVPYWLISVLHMRESSGNFNTYLGNGEPLNRKTRLVPKGRGPFATFEDGAVDALKIDGLSSVVWKFTPESRGAIIEKVLFHCEAYNGWGYANKSGGGLPSPYVWGGTNIQKPGKYIADGKFSSTVMDTQPGCAPIIATLAKMDATIQFQRETVEEIA